MKMIAKYLNVSRGTIKVQDDKFIKPIKQF